MPPGPPPHLPVVGLSLCAPCVCGACGAAVAIVGFGDTDPWGPSASWSGTGLWGRPRVCCSTTGHGRVGMGWGDPTGGRGHPPRSLCAVQRGSGAATPLVTVTAALGCPSCTVPFPGWEPPPLPPAEPPPVPQSRQPKHKASGPAQVLTQHNPGELGRRALPAPQNPPPCGRGPPSPSEPPRLCPPIAAPRPPGALCLSPSPSPRPE